MTLQCHFPGSGGAVERKEGFSDMRGHQSSFLRGNASYGPFWSELLTLHGSATVLAVGLVVAVVLYAVLTP